MGSEASTPAKINEHPGVVTASHGGGRRMHAKSLLNARQEELLRKSWQHSHSSGSDSVGARIFRKIFITEPTLARIFGLEGIVPADVRRQFLNAVFVIPN